MILAAIIFFIGFVFHGFGFHPNAWVTWPSFVLLGLFFLALELSGAVAWGVARVRR